MATKKTTSTRKRTTKNKGNGNNGDGGNGGGTGGDGEPFEEAPENIDVHEAYLEYRLGGGERPSSRAYARAAEQFNRLPGAIRGKPAFIPPDPPDDDDGDTDTDNDSYGTGEKP